MASEEPMTHATSASGVTTDSQLVDAGSNPDKRQREEDFEEVLKKKMRLYAKADEEEDEKQKIFIAAEQAYSRAEIDYEGDCDEKRKEFEAAEEAYFRAREALTAASNLRKKLAKDTFKDKGAKLTLELTNRLWKEIDEQGL